MIGVTLSSNIIQKSNFLSQRENGAVIKFLVPKGPAEKGGLKVNDIIISIDDEKISTPADVVKIINKNNFTCSLVSLSSQCSFYSIIILSLSLLSWFYYSQLVLICSLLIRSLLIFYHYYGLRGRKHDYPIFYHI